MMEPTELESYLLEDWSQAPEEAIQIAQRASADGCPTGIGYVEEIGWFVLQTAGQGPILIWKDL